MELSNSQISLYSHIDVFSKNVSTPCDQNHTCALISTHAKILIYATFVAPFLGIIRIIQNIGELFYRATFGWLVNYRALEIHTKKLLNNIDCLIKGIIQTIPIFGIYIYFFYQHSKSAIDRSPFKVDIQVKPNPDPKESAITLAAPIIVMASPDSLFPPDKILETSPFICTDIVSAYIALTAPINSRIKLPRIGEGRSPLSKEEILETFKTKRFSVQIRTLKSSISLTTPLIMKINGRYVIIEKVDEEESFLITDSIKAECIKVSKATVETLFSNGSIEAISGIQKL